MVVLSVGTGDDLDEDDEHPTNGLARSVGCRFVSASVGIALRSVVGNCLTVVELCVFVEYHIVFQHPEF